MNNDATIAAISTPIGTGGIGIIRLSGNNSIRIAHSVFKPARKIRANTSTIPQQYESHRFYYGHVVDPDSKRIIDEAMMVCMKAPKSYTREDVVEIHIHSGIIVLREALELVVRQGGRLAAPGEFTRRAFLNGRIDLIRAEAVIDLINAKSSSSLIAIQHHISGELSRIIDKIKNELFNVLTIIEAGIDFPEDVEEKMIDAAALAESLESMVIVPCQQLIRGYDSCHFIRDGLSLAVVGRPNVGKSSLMNRLVGKHRSIVTDIPGTTRDLIEEPMTIEGIPILLCDTAGLHQTHCPIETMGIQKTHECIASCDLVLFVLDATAIINREDLEIFEHIKDKSLILVLNKTDLIEDGHDEILPESWASLPRFKVSAKYDLGIESLRQGIIGIVSGDSLKGVGDLVIPNIRQKLLLEKAVAALMRAVDGMYQNIPFELLAIDLNEGLAALNEIEGIVQRTDVLDGIFSKFCIGK